MSYDRAVRWNRKRSVPELCTAFANAVDNQDGRATTRILEELAGAIPGAGPAVLTDGLRTIRPLLTQVPFGNGAVVATLVSALVEAGANPSPVLDVVVDRVVDGLEQAARFPALAGTRVAPPTDSATAQAVVTQVAAAGRLGREEASRVTQAWFAVDDWIPALLVPLQQKRARQSLPQRRRLIDATAVAAEHIGNAEWLGGLLVVLDDEPIVVVHRESGAVFSVTISGIGDTFQLHTLLAHALIDGGLVPGTPPHPSWVAAATDGPLEPATPIRGQFNLVDASGAWIWNEGRPADIAPVAGRRVVVLDPPPYDRGWNVGRTYPLMLPELRLDGALPPTEAARWRRVIAPAKPPTARRG